MLKNLQIKNLTNVSPDFYKYMGKVFGSRFIEKQIGIKVYDDANKNWVIATRENQIIGFCSLKSKTVSDCFVYPEYRLSGVFDLMLDELMKSNGNYRAVCTIMSVRAFLKRGFKIAKQTKNFIYVERINA
jgi:hypothetical protein